MSHAKLLPNSVSNLHWVRLFAGAPEHEPKRSSGSVSGPGAGVAVLVIVALALLGLGLGACGDSSAASERGEGADVADAGDASDLDANDSANDARDADPENDVRADADAADSEPEDTSADAGEAGLSDSALADIDVADGAATDAADTDAASDAPPTRCRGRLPTVYGPELVPSPDWLEAELVACTPAAHAMVVPRAARWEVTLRGVPADARAFAYGPAFRRADRAGAPRPPTLGSSGFAGPEGELSLEFVAPHSGEHVVVVERDDLSFAGPYEVRAVCREGCELEATRYPIVLVHGYAGVDSYFGLLDYFYDVYEPLRALGYEVFRPVTDAIATSERRSQQLATQVDEILRTTGAERINIIAHSQGGLDARLLASGMGYGDRIASITTVATPHLGVEAVLFDFFSAQSFAVDVMEEFNAANPDVEGVRYWSWSARSCSRLDFSCQRDADGEVIEVLLIATFTLLSRFGDSDGIITTSAMLWGEHLGQLNADHFDEIGQVADGSPDGDPFDHRAFYRSEVRRLAAEGL